MKWKDVLLGAFASLVVTVLGGMAVYYFTKEPEFSKRERLVYSIQESASFTGGAKDVVFSTIRLRNIGGVAAKNVTIATSVASAKVLDVALETDAASTPATKELTESEFSATYKTLLPNEGITLNLLLSSSERPTVSMRSDETLGVEISSDQALEAPATRLTRFLEASIPVTAALLSVVMGALLLWLRRSGRLQFMQADKNNAGFLLLHHGFVEEATELLVSSLNSGRYDSFVLSNLALCKALKGNGEDAKRLLRAASFHNTAGHSRAVVLFNEALVSLVLGDKDEAAKHLRSALALSTNDVRRYCKRSVHLDQVRGDPAFDQLIRGP